MRTLLFRYLLQPGGVIILVVPFFVRLLREGSFIFEQFRLWLQVVFLGIVVKVSVVQLGLIIACFSVILIKSGFDLLLWRGLGFGDVPGVSSSFSGAGGTGGCQYLLLSRDMIRILVFQWLQVLVILGFRLVGRGVIGIAIGLFVVLIIIEICEDGLSPPP